MSVEIDELWTKFSVKNPPSVLALYAIQRESGLITVDWWDGSKLISEYPYEPNIRNDDPAILWAETDDLKYKGG